MSANTCLNCNKELVDRFCSGCGQKADTHRISFKHFILHDLLHGTFHLDKGILFTAKESLFRPGQAALDYISGKRIRYYNVFYLILLTIGLMLFTRHIGDLFFTDTAQLEPEKIYPNEASRKIDEIISQKSKLILLLFVPFAALNSFMLFGRRKLNLSEHAILAGMILLGLLLIATLSNLYFPINNFLNLNGTIASMVVTLILLVYVCYGYINAFGSDYAVWGMAWRLVLFFGLICAELYLLFLLIFGFVSDWKFGTVSLTPFS